MASALSLLHHRRAGAGSHKSSGDNCRLQAGESSAMLGSLCLSDAQVTSPWLWHLIICIICTRPPVSADSPFLCTARCWGCLWLLLGVQVTSSLQGVSPRCTALALVVLFVPAEVPVTQCFSPCRSLCQDQEACHGVAALLPTQPCLWPNLREGQRADWVQCIPPPVHTGMR
jgi:hypothetical protein